jgi:hypothetical protein
MDEHNETHNNYESEDRSGNGLGQGLSIVNKNASSIMAAIRRAGLASRNNSLDLEVADLPEPLNHKHTE